MLQHHAEGYGVERAMFFALAAEKIIDHLAARARIVGGNARRLEAQDLPAPLTACFRK
jgi:hypothetical protein